MTEPRAPASWRDTADGYGRLSILLHWATALLVLTLAGLGLLMEWTITFEDQSLYARLKYTHISVGVALGVLVVPRLAWRVWSGWPVLRMRSRVMRFLARLMPCLLLAAVVAQAVTGVAARWSARAWPAHDAASLPLLGLIEIPSPFERHRPELNRLVEAAHDTMADVLLVLVLLHALAALAHVLVARRRP